jgi:hypothetical protein
VSESIRKLPAIRGQYKSHDETVDTTNKTQITSNIARNGWGRRRAIRGLGELGYLAAAAASASTAAAVLVRGIAEVADGGSGGGGGGGSDAAVVCATARLAAATTAAAVIGCRSVWEGEG